MTLRIPADLLPADGRFGSGPSKVRPEALEYLALRADLMGTSHRQAPVRDLVAAVQDALARLYSLPDGYEVVLGNGGATQFWDIAVSSLVERRSSHAVFGEFSRKFATASARAPHLDEPLVTEVSPGSAALPRPGDADVYAWPQNETSTGACASVRRVADEGLMLVDATSSAGGMAADIAETDVYYFAPQKNFASDGGLWFAFCSPAAIERAERIKASGRWLPETLDLSVAVDNSRRHQTLNTPAIATLLLLEDQLGWLEANGGLEFAVARCVESSSRLYEWAEQHPLTRPFVRPEHRSPVVATIDLDDSVRWADVSAILRANGVVDVDPYRGLNRNQLRIGVYASVDPDDVTALTRCLDVVLDSLA